AALNRLRRKPWPHGSPRPEAGEKSQGPQPSNHRRSGRGEDHGRRHQPHQQPPGPPHRHRQLRQEPPRHPLRPPPPRGPPQHHPPAHPPRAAPRPHQPQAPAAPARRPPRRPPPPPPEPPHLPCREGDAWYERLHAYVLETKSLAKHLATQAGRRPHHDPLITPEQHARAGGDTCPYCLNVNTRIADAPRHLTPYALKI